MKTEPGILNKGRFDRRIDWARVVDREKDCWIWTSTVFTTMSGKRRPWLWTRDFDHKERKVAARRLAFELEFNRVLETEEWLGLYSCGEDLCVNPHHAKVTGAKEWRRDLGLDSTLSGKGVARTEEEFTKS
jgi:hypothetical protein